MLILLVSTLAGIQSHPANSPHSHLRLAGDVPPQTVKQGDGLSLEEIVAVAKYSSVPKEQELQAD